jgi:putative hydrolase of HD superfamily
VIGVADMSSEQTPQSILSFLDHVNDLKQLPRMGWLLAGVASPESVADHTCAVALLALALSEQINEDWQAEGLAHPLDVGRVLRVALLHDLAESILTDLPKRSSDLIGKPVKHAAEATAIQRILVGLPQHDEWLALWSEYDAASTPEARLVRDADKLEMIHQATRYMRRGQTNLGEFLRDHVWSYRLCEQLQAVLSESTNSSTLTAEFAVANYRGKT